MYVGCLRCLTIHALAAELLARLSHNELLLNRANSSSGMAVESPHPNVLTSFTNFLGWTTVDIDEDRYHINYVFVLRACSADSGAGEPGVTVEISKINIVAFDAKNNWVGAW